MPLSHGRIKIRWHCVRTRFRRGADKRSLPVDVVLSPAVDAEGASGFSPCGMLLPPGRLPIPYASSSSPILHGTNGRKTSTRPDRIQPPNRVGGGIAPAVLPHHADVPFDIRRFMKQTGSVGEYPTTKPVPCDRSSSGGRSGSYAWRRRSTTGLGHWWLTATSEPYLSQAFIGFRARV